MRPLTKAEQVFLSTITQLAGCPLEIPTRGRSLTHGGRGSLSFDPTGSQERAQALIAGRFIDSDGVLVDFELTRDKHGNLFILDLWKVDFSPLLNFPAENKIKLTYPA